MNDSRDVHAQWNRVYLVQLEKPKRSKTHLQQLNKHLPNFLQNSVLSFTTLYTLRYSNSYTTYLSITNHLKFQIP